MTPRGPQIIASGVLAPHPTTLASSRAARAQARRGERVRAARRRGAGFRLLRGRTA